VRATSSWYYATLFAGPIGGQSRVLGRCAASGCAFGLGGMNGYICTQTRYGFDRSGVPYNESNEYPHPKGR
jgi:hypothetical protein